MKVFITKYALTAGIETIEAKHVTNCHAKEMIEKIGDTERVDFPTYFHGKGKEWHETWEGAVKHAEEMRQKKILSVEKQLKKLRELKFC